ncbi:nuclear pore complex assembly-domain-containing protein [Cyathus striatus]|nr:nuclear pore complex assembly-domain-containing protein [Cyathus striatus]
MEVIEHRRALLSDQLLFDILLSSGGIRVPDLIYPPRDEEGLQRLLDSIAQSQYDSLKKDCLVYFLLKWHQDGREERFKANRCIPPQFAALADAYWYLDSGVQVAKAVSLLSDARLNRDYASKILQAISLSPDSAALIRQYVRTAQPSLTEPDDLDLYTLALAENSFFDAWQFQRTFPETKEIRPRLWKKLVEWCIALNAYYSGTKTNPTKISPSPPAIIIRRIPAAQLRNDPLY